MTKRQLVPADAQEILERALWFARAEGFDVPGADVVAPRWQRDPVETRFDAARVHLLRAAVALAEYAGDIELLPLVLEAHAEHVELSRYFEARCDHDVFSSAIATLLAHGAPVTDEVRRLAEDPDPAIRLALVTGLKDAAVEFEPLLRSMADDLDAEVRTAAKKALAELGAPPWWVGLFSRDPAVVLGPEQAAALGPKLTRWAELLTQRYLQQDARREVYALLDDLPDALARDAILRMMSGDRGLWEGASLAARLGRVPDGVDEVIELACRDQDYRFHSFVEQYAACPAARTEQAARRVLAALIARPSDERGDSGSPAWRLGDLLRQLWPDDGDATDIIGQAMAEFDDDDHSGYHFDAVATALADLSGRSPACAARFKAEALDGFLRRARPALWRRYWPLTKAVLASLEGEERREVARAALGSDEGTVSWGLEQLLGPAHDPERDPPIDELLVTFCAEPRLRHAVLRNKEWVARRADWFRAELHADRVQFEDACGLISALAAPDELMLYAYLHRTWDGDDEDAHGLLRDRAPSGSKLTAEDWAAWRRARDASDEDKETVHSALFTLPLAPLCPEDRAYVHRAFERIRDGEGGPALGCAVALMAGGTEADMPLMDELVRRDDNDRVAELRERMKRRLGLVPRRTRGGKAEKRPTDKPTEWMDEDD